MTIKKTPKLLFWSIAVALLLSGMASLSNVVLNQQSGSLVINELSASNQSGLTDEDGEFSDWIEIHNPGTMAVNLSGMALTDDVKLPEKWRFPSMILKGGHYLVVFASGKDRSGADLHTNFKLSRAGEFVGLYNILDQKFIDVISPKFPRQFKDVSYGYTDSAETAKYLVSTTPGQPNDTEVLWDGVVESIEFSAKRGFYDKPFSLVLKVPLDATVRYTLDGSEPTPTTGAIYTAPISIETTTLVRAAAFKPGYRPSAIETHSFIFLEDVIRQPANPPGFPAYWGQYSTTYKQFKEGDPVPADYGMDPEITNDSRYKNTLTTDLQSLPSLSLVINPKSLAIYAKPLEHGPDWERAVSLELIDPSNSERNVQVNAGLRIQGGRGRLEFVPKHSFRLFFRDKYGAATFKYPFFPNSPVEEFNTLVIRGGSQGSFAGHPRSNRENKIATYTQDEWLRASQIALSGIGSHGTFVHLYINGLYWGLYNVVERPDAAFTSSYMGGQRDDWFAVKHGQIPIGDSDIKGEPLHGSSPRFEALHILVAEGGLEDPERYAAIQEYLDIAKFIDYVILNWYADNRDWPDTNWFAGVKNPDGQVMYFVWDGELTWKDGARTSLNKEGAVGWPNSIKPLFRALMQNPDFRMTFADRLYKHLFNDGELSDSNALARWLSINRQIERAIVGESARWGDARFEKPLTRDDWLSAVDIVSAQMKGNANKLVQLTRESGYYPLLNPPQFSQYGGRVEAGFELTISAENKGTAVIYYTTDSSDPRMPVTGNISSAAQVYQAPLVLTDSTYIKSRLYDGGGWSAMHEATFAVVDRGNQLHISEIMYNPPGSDDYEFIELKNNGSSSFDLSGLSFEGINFLFPANSSLLAPGQFVVLVKNRNAFAKKYSDVPIGGEYQGRLSNEGEVIELKDPQGKVVATVAYYNGTGWPISPDGRGDSLVLVNFDGNPHDPKSWQGSLHPGGSPGNDEPQRFRQ